MKTIAIVLVSAFVASLCLESGADCPYPNGSGANATTGETFVWGCGQFTCLEDGGWLGKGCAEVHCHTERQARSYSLSKPYPECCPSCEN